MFPKMPTAGLKRIVLGMILLGCFACSQKSYIAVDYRLPTVSDSLAGRRVFVQTRDLRSDAEIFNPRAKSKFEKFTGLFSLSLIKANDPPKVVGAFELPMLFETALKQRLTKLGISLADAPSAGTPIFQISINRFRIDLVGQKWLTDISYEASLTGEDGSIARETVSGSAERLKIMGSGGAEKVVGEIFTEMINRLDIERLFVQAGL